MMRTITACVLALTVAAGVSAAQGTTTPPPTAPPAGSPATYKSEKELLEVRWLAPVK